jgi:putative endopeptidase
LRISISIRKKYVEHIQKMFQLIGDDSKSAKNDAEQILKFETRLAGASNTRVENRDPEATYNRMSTSEIMDRYSKFNWEVYFTELEIGDPLKVDISQPKFVAEFSDMVSEESLDDWISYLKWNLINSMADYLSSDFVNQNFDFYGKTLRGQQTLRARWKRVIDITNNALGEAVGQLYVKEYFPPEAKERAKQIVESLVVSMEESIKNLDWMSDETKEQAQKKFAGFGIKIGYPDKWIDYTEYDVTDESFVQNIIRSNYFDHLEMLKEINQPVKEWEWGMTPQTVNAYYSPTRNEIVFPAAILQFPFYDFEVDDAINYGAMGAAIGHEITHGFDDQGGQYDEAGNIRNWWTEEDAKKFDERAQMVIKQFNAYSPIDTFHLNGALTNGENIADLGGITIAYNAFTKTEQFKEGKLIDGFTPQQRFFLSWAQIWKGNVRDEEVIRLLTIDPHSPGYFRTIGPLSNFPPFFEAFDVKEGDPMRRSEIIKIW